MNQESKFKFIKNKYFLIGVAILIIIALFALKSNNGKETPNHKVTLGEVVQEVLISGSVKSANFVDLAFEKTGSIQWINKDVSDTVYQGEVIANIENGAEKASLDDAIAKLQSEEARYDELSLGSRPEEIKIKEIELSQNEQTLSNYYENISQTINDTYNKADSAINKQADPLFSNDQSSSPQLSFIVNDQQAKNDAESSRLKAGVALKDIENINDKLIELVNLEKSAPESETALKDTKNRLLIVQTFLIKISSALNSATSLSETNLATYKDNIATGRTNINTAIQSVSDLIDDIASQKILVEKSKQELELEKIGATKEVLSQAKASIERAKATIKSAESALSKTIMRSPINGTVTKQDGKVGEIVSAGSKIVSVMGKENFEIETNIPESDLSKVKIGDMAKITLDAFSKDEIVEATVSSIDPAEKIVDGVSTYKTILQIQNPVTGLRSGMTTDIRIVTARKQDVLFVPQKAIKTTNNVKFVTILKNDSEIEQREIVTGLKGTDGNVEVLSGISQGEKVSLEPISN